MHASRASRLTPVAAKKFLRSVVSRAYGLSPDRIVAARRIGGTRHGPVSDDLQNYIYDVLRVEKKSTAV